MTTEGKTNRKRIALVIGAGSVKCAAALGLQKVLAREGIDISMVVGCSGGSIYAAMIAIGWDVQTATELTKKLWTRDITQKRNARALFSIVLPGLFGFNERFGALDDRRILETLKSTFGDKRIEQTKIPLYIAATDYMMGEQVIMSQGPLVDALRASIAIPFIFPAWPVGERLLVDGGLSDPLPVGVAIKEGANLIIAMGFESAYQTHINSLTRFSFQISSIMSNNLLKANFAFHNLAHHAEVLPIIPEFKEHIKLFDTDKISYIIEEGERAMEKQLAYVRRALEVS